MSIPISPQGVGTAEFVALKLLVQPSLATANQVIVMLMIARLYQLVYSLSGAGFLLKGDIHLKPEMDDSKETQAGLRDDIH
ncbi:MAG: hypothetical protein HC898_09925 [Phycisphaerales bacterium]|nr:hypothetical protein [Phycisphaerales bacterium]